MNDQELMQLLMAVDELDQREAFARERAACLTFTRARQLALSPGLRTEGERVHVESCGHCQCLLRVWKRNLDHPSLESLRQWLRGLLEGGERESLRRHLEVDACEQCRTLLEKLRREAASAAPASAAFAAMSVAPCAPAALTLTPRGGAHRLSVDSRGLSVDSLGVPKTMYLRKFFAKKEAPMRFEFTLSDLLSVKYQKLGREAFADKINAAVLERARRADVPRDELLGNRWRGKLHRALHPPAPLTPDFDAIAQCFEELEIAPSVEICRVPWDSWQPGNKVVLAIGEKTSDHTSSDALRRRRIDFLDGRGENLLVNRLASSAGIECTFALRSVPEKDSGAGQKLKSWIEEPGVGAIIVLGSDRTNCLADPVARWMLEDQRPPATFRRSERIPKDSILSDPRPVRGGPVGIDDVGGLRYPRDLDDGILTRLRANPAVPARNHEFWDSGILMIDARTRPLLVLAAGHGGHGTLGCVMALVQERAEIERRIRASREPEMRERLPVWIGANRFFDVVQVKLRKPTLDPVDDMEVDTIQLAWPMDPDEDDQDRNAFPRPAVVRAAPKTA